MNTCPTRRGAPLAFHDSLPTWLAQWQPTLTNTVAINDRPPAAPRCLAVGRSQRRAVAFALRSAAPKEVEHVIVRHLGGVREDRTQRIRRELRIGGEQLLRRPTCRKEAQQAVDGEACAANNRLPDDDLGIGDYVVLPWHMSSPGESQDRRR